MISSETSIDGVHHLRVKLTPDHLNYRQVVLVEKKEKQGEKEKN